jgi:hypothetical protein
MSSKMSSKGKTFFLWAFLCLVLLVNRSTTELNNYQLTQIVTKLEKQLNSEKVHFDETITALKNQFKIKLVQLKNEAKSNFNQTMNVVNTLSTTVERLDKISKVAISCFELAQKGKYFKNSATICYSEKIPTREVDKLYCIFYRSNFSGHNTRIMFYKQRL